MTSNRNATLGRMLRGTKLAPMLFCIGISSVGAADGVNTGYFGNVAIGGYDPVSYFTDGRATKGNPAISQIWLGATWYFSKPTHRDAFASDPIRYAPQYGGFCAMGAAGEQASANIDPEAWRIVGGKLYLFSGKEGLEDDFDARAADVIARADVKWPEVQRKEFHARHNGN